MKTATHGLNRVNRVSKRDSLFSARLPEMETEKRSNCPFPVSFVDRLCRWTGAHKACPLSVDLSPCMRARSCEEFRRLCSKISWDI